MHVNTRIVTAGALLIASSFYLNRVVNHDPARKKTLTRIVVAGYVVTILASIVDMVYAPLGALATMIMMGAVVLAAWTILPDFFGRIAGQQK